MIIDTSLGKEGTQHKKARSRQAEQAGVRTDGAQMIQTSEGEGELQPPPAVPLQSHNPVPNLKNKNENEK